jgi:protein-tyrosine-phosphatase/tRNA A37 threonylcarbamoyladenosine synthetase subunit TsaC/SUA5/YrdC
MPTPTSTLPQNAVLPSTPAGLAAAADLLRQGKLVLLPTETVYGIAVNLLSPDARAAATALKGGITPNWVLHVATPDDVIAWAPCSLSPLARRLITKALPGPVAFQIKLSDQDAAAARTRLGDAADDILGSPLQNSEFRTQNSLTIRCPEFPQTQKIIELAAVPVAIIGAGTPTHPTIFELADLPEGLVGEEASRGGETPKTDSDGQREAAKSPQIAAALDGGPTRYRRASTLVSLDGDHFSVTRPGVIDERILQKMADFNILFVCSGNTCRSPMAAALATKILADKLGILPSELPLRHIVVQSAGVHANRGSRATREAVEAVKPLGADLSTHLSQPATPDVLRRADVIYTMTTAHLDEVLHLAPAAAKKASRLDPAGDVADPIGSALSVYTDVAGHLAELLQQRLSELRI